MSRPVVPELALKPLASISPSRFNEVRRCGLRGAWAAARNPEFLPGAPGRRLGTVIHRLFEEAERGQLVGEAAIAARFDTLAAAADAEMRRSWLERSSAPLAASVADYAQHRRLALATAAELSAGALAAPAVAAAARRRTSGAEVKLVARGGRVAGRADRILDTSNGAVIQDAKTGRVFEPAPDGSLQLKQAYVTQLLLYAAMYAEDLEVSGGAWPARLELVPSGSDPVPVPFDPTECEKLLDEAEDALARLNKVISQPGSRRKRELLLARPSVEACRWCPYRPACDAYLGTASGRADQEDWPRDLWGIVTDLRRLGNGTVSMTVDAKGQPTRVRGLSPDPQRHPVIGELEPGTSVAIFNLLMEGGTNTRGEGQYTVIYRAAP
jgi:hypothetical protein